MKRTRLWDFPKCTHSDFDQQRVIISGECLFISFRAGMSLVGIFKSCTSPNCCADNDELLFEVGICVSGVSSLRSIEDPCFGIKGPSASVKLYARHEAAALLNWKQ